MSQDITSPGGSAALTPNKSTARVRDQKSLTNDNRTRGNIEQYILSQNIEKAANYFNSRRELFNYQTFRQVNGDGTQMVNKLRGIENIEVFNKVKTSVLSLMMPKVRIYKVSHEEAGFAEDGTPDEGKTQRLPFPCYKEFKFSDNFGQETAATVQDYLNYESTKPSYRNVGLESFSIIHDGKSEGILEQNIQCSLKLTFKSLKDLTAQPPGEPHPEKGGLRYVDLILWPPARYVKDAETHNPLHYEIKAMIGYSAPSKQALEGLNLTLKEVEMLSHIEKLNTIVSLSLVDYKIGIGEQGQVTLTANYRGRLETIVGTNSVNIFQDTMRLGHGGKEKISKSVDPKNNPAHIFKIQSMIHEFFKELNQTHCRNDKCSSRKKLLQVLKSDTIFSSIYREAGGPAVTENRGVVKVVGNGEDIFLWFKQAINSNRMLALIRRRVGGFKKDVYKTFVDQLITGNDARDELDPETRLFCINVPKEEVVKYLGAVEPPPDNQPIATLDELTKQGVSYSDAMQQIMTGGTTAVPRGSSKIKIDRCNKAIQKDAALQETVAQDISSLEANRVEDINKEKKDPSRKTTLNFDGENYKFYFIYFGDIIELACKNAGFKALDLINEEEVGGEASTAPSYPPFPPNTYYGYGKKRGDINKEAGRNYGLGQTRVLLGPLEYTDPETGVIKNINLAQFPISFNYFRSWFTKRIIRKKSPAMSLGGFLIECMNKLIMPALGAGMPSSVKPSRTRSAIQALTLPGKQTGEDPVEICGRIVGRIEETLPLHRVLNVDGSVFREAYLNRLIAGQSSETMIKTSHDYLLIRTTTAKDMMERTGNPIEDLKDGIYHFNIGSDNGLLKTMDFNKVSITGLAEAKWKIARDQGADPLGQLMFPFDTNLDLIGTSLFVPGMYYYVNPSMLGLGNVEDARSVSYQLGLGGYHIVQTVTSTIRKGTYTTKIEGKQTFQGRPK